MHESGEATAARFVDRTIEREAPLQTLAAIVSHGQLLKNLVLRDLKLKYRGSALGFLWSMINPLAFLLVYTFAFKIVLRTTQPDYSFFVLVGVLSWGFFSNSATMSTGAIIESAGLVRAVKFPIAILPVATVFFNLAQYLLTIAVFLPAMFIVHRSNLALPMLLFPVVLALQALFTIGVALLLSAATTYFRDVRHLVEVGLLLLFWTTPIVYSADMVQQPALKAVILLSPMSPFIVAYQRILYQGTLPDPSTWVIAFLYALFALVVGVSVFVSLKDGLVEQI